MVDEKPPYYGRDRRESRERRVVRSSDKRRANALLPHPSVLERYEEVAPGSSGRLIHMAEEELLRRHDWEDQYLREYMRLHRLGQMFGFILSLATVAAAFYLFVQKEWFGASVIIVGGFGSLVLASMASMMRRRFENRPHKKQNTSSR